MKYKLTLILSLIFIRTFCMDVSQDECSLMQLPNELLVIILEEALQPESQIFEDLNIWQSIAKAKKEPFRRMAIIFLVCKNFAQFKLFWDGRSKKLEGLYRDLLSINIAGKFRCGESVRAEWFKDLISEINTQKKASIDQMDFLAKFIVSGIWSDQMYKALHCISSIAGNVYSERLVSLLCFYNIDLNYKLNNGVSALSWASKNNNKNVVKALLDHHANVNLVDDDRNSAPIHWACSFKSMDALRLLLDHGADVNIQDKKGSTILSTINYVNTFSPQGHMNYCVMLLNYNADPSVLDNDGRTVSELLFKKGASREVCGFLETYPILLREAQSNPSHKLLLTAMANDYLVILKILVGSGVSIYPQDLELAKNRRSKMVVKYLIGLNYIKLITKYGLISKNGIFGIYNLPDEVVNLIARFA